MMLPKDPKRRYYWIFFLKLDLLLLALLALLWWLGHR